MCALVGAEGEPNDRPRDDDTTVVVVMISMTMVSSLKTRIGTKTKVMACRNLQSGSPICIHPARVE